MFLNSLPSLPQHREIEFGIDLVLGVTPIFITLYRLAPAELNELKVQLEDLSSKGFIQPSSSPWEAHVLFAKKADGSLYLYTD